MERNGTLQQRARPLRLAVVASLASALLAACGGGGGGADAPVASPASNAPGMAVARAGTTGFVPAAPMAGETLHADAGALRPLRDEALWVYRGTRAVGSSRQVFTSFRQTVASSSGHAERVSSPLDGASGVQQVSVSGGIVQLRDSLLLPAAAAPSGIVELRSPVRRGDQVTLADATAVALKDDVDGDRLTDHADIGSYSRVIGDEDVELPELGRTLRALRVDVTTITRVQRSSRTQPDPATTVVTSSWYAPGIGLVRRTATLPSTDGVGAVDTDERLQYWDGIDKGVGLVPSSPVTAAGTLGGTGPGLQAPLSAVRSGAGAFVLSAREGMAQRPDLGVVLSVLDGRGRIVSSVEHVDLGLERGAQPQLMALGDGVALVSTERGVYADPYQLENLRLLRFDAHGYRGASAWLASGALPGTLKAASDGQSVWVTWVEPGLAAGTTRTMVQAFDASGRALAAPRALDSRGTGATVSGIAIAAASGRALVAWRVTGAAGDELRQALVTGAGAQAAVATLETGVPGLGTARSLPMPRLSASLAALTWYDPLRPAAGTGTAPVAPRGVALDANALPLRSSHGTADEESLQQLPAHDAQRSAMQADADALLWAAAGSARLRAEEIAEDRYLDFAALQPSAGPLATAAVRLQRFRDRSPAVLREPAAVSVRHLVALEDRWLILGHDGTRMTAAVLYRP
jgi:hypothetical protein